MAVAIQVKDCEMCGKEIKAPWNRDLCDYCRLKQCENCGKLYLPRRKQSKYCSKLCLNNSKRTFLIEYQHIKSGLIETKCSNCEKIIYRYPHDFKRSKKFYCSNKCNTDSKIGKPSSKRTTTSVNCVECKKEIYRAPSRLNKYKSQFCDSRCKGNWMSKNLRGEKHWNWQNGKTEESRLRKNRKEWRDWRTEIFKRDDYTCQLCFIRGVELHPHHIKPQRKYPKLIYDIDNGITLCKKCHLKTLNKENKYIKYFNNILSFNNIFTSFI